MQGDLGRERASLRINRLAEALVRDMVRGLAASPGFSSAVLSGGDEALARVSRRVATCAVVVARETVLGLDRGRGWVGEVVVEGSGSDGGGLDVGGNFPP